MSFPLSAWASQGVSCALEYHADETVFAVPEAPDTLGGRWTEIGRFKVRTLLASPAENKSWLLVEVYAKSADNDLRIITSQKVFSPFRTGRVEVGEPHLGSLLNYQCGPTP